MNDLKTIVSATDFSACSLRALRQAGRLAIGSGAALHVLHVIDSDALDGLASTVPFSREELTEQLTGQATARLDAAAADVPGSASAELHVHVGYPLDTILGAVESLSADLLVVGAYGEGGAGRGAGTLATKCARRCPANVLLVHETQADPSQTVIACVDLSVYTDQVVAAAAQMATMEDARLVLLHVHHNPFDVFRWGLPVVDNAGRYKAYVAALRGQLERIRDRVQAPHDGITIECEVLFGIDYGRSIVAHARKRDADLVVLGAKGRTNLSYVLLGSSPERVLRETTSSVLTVRSPLPSTAPS